MTESDDDLELKALEYKLGDAFETTRPRPGFEDELWLEVQSSRPAPRRLRDAMAAFWQGVREVPAVPAAATAAVLVIAIGAGIVVLNGAGHGGGGATRGASTALGREGPAAGQYIAGNFGRLPSPVFNSSPKATAPSTAAAPFGADYSGPVKAVWAGTLDLHITTVPVFRYREPSIDDADQFASALGAVLRERPAGFLGTYSAADYTLKIRGTVASPASSPAYFIFSGLNVPAVDAAGGPQDLADVFLAEHSLQPQWQATVSVDSSGDPVKVAYQRQFDVAGYGPAYLVDGNANRYGLEVDLSGNRPVLASGMLPVSLEVADYNIMNPSAAINAAVTTASNGTGASPSNVPTLQLNHAELVYVLVPQGDHSFYEPAYLFTGALDAGGKSYTRHVLVSGIDPSQRTS